MNIDIIIWSEGLYDDYMKIIADNVVVHNGYFYRILSNENNIIGLELNYGEEGTNHNVYLKKYKEKIITVPDYNLMYKYNYIYKPVEFTFKEIEKIKLEEEMPKIRNITIEDIVLSWILTSEFKDYCSNMEEYKKLLSRNIYYVSDEKLNENIEERFTELFNIKEGIIEEVSDISEYEIIEVYLNKGTVWNAFLKKDNEIYLNTGLSISIKIKF
ncbi:hypothetical protein EII29_11040 [Leptotrichia sp. OH3620_COT-345]|uniref:hypothetical protein n=1 Tax=Leptotrichia sp. OH3620_COT-345 TaxID=2491048 RepID=UPI000F651656|nr:hypothetical protein [Leptotrichia sp. OH3620_COT-345]RRD37706.1 hypothetical protein EII29_11040 [Leptotrichia sp. OH3620_COT-345]